MSLLSVIIGSLHTRKQIRFSDNIMTHWAHTPEIQWKHFAEVKGKLKGFEPDMKEYQG